ncbi:hypothetical protein [Chryseolinea lacunae]|uniref:Lipocalin-like domain-containing protein n=1 Tax=Chryseolinea lacunae TaxID=2801331 RepID=A0ABS1KW56_9BACT|nr:hypothetical protein [Chryseolinea lacunae]MBL0743699.1 hypothetical protein [Chryseolinea lacunae]
MKTIITTLLCFAAPALALAQTFTREELVGAWTCKEVSYSEAIPAEESAAVEKTKRGLVQSRFVFQQNGFFVMQLPANAPIEFKELESLNNKMWHIKAKERMVFVGSLDDDLMILNVKNVNGLFYFSIQDTPLVLRMEKNR